MWLIIFLTQMFKQLEGMCDKYVNDSSPNMVTTNVQRKFDPSIVDVVCDAFINNIRGSYISYNNVFDVKNNVNGSANVRFIKMYVIKYFMKIMIIDGVGSYDSAKKFIVLMNQLRTSVGSQQIKQPLAQSINSDGEKLLVFETCILFARTYVMNILEDVQFMKVLPKNICYIMLYWLIATKYTYAKMFIVMIPLAEFKSTVQPSVSPPSVSPPSVSPKLLPDGISSEIKSWCNDNDFNEAMSLYEKHNNDDIDVNYWFWNIRTIIHLFSSFSKQIASDIQYYRDALEQLVSANDYANLNNAMMIIYKENRNGLVKIAPTLLSVYPECTIIKVLLKQPVDYYEHNMTLFPLEGTGELQFDVLYGTHDPTGFTYAYTYAALWVCLHNEPPPDALVHPPPHLLASPKAKGKTITINALWKTKFTGVEVPPWMKKDSEYQKIVNRCKSLMTQQTGTSSVRDGYIYILQRECYKGTNKYKIGKTTNWDTRKKAADYRNCDLHFLIHVNGKDAIERNIITSFATKYPYIDSDEHGSEDFCGEIDDMIIDVINIVYS
jgi:hypothetical protein